MNREFLGGKRLDDDVPDTTGQGKIKIPSEPLSGIMAPAIIRDDPWTNTLHWMTLPPYDSVGSDEPVTRVPYDQILKGRFCIFDCLFLVLLFLSFRIQI
ncbi:hypothetical protein QCA50_016592 [Cerrena zonata]|uniref:Uncharacterized protein n=1 Tax=Cerrena zonata TaxID=2478898 RepID=A0AAW0FST2_9APHY